MPSAVRPEVEGNGFNRINEIEGMDLIGSMKSDGGKIKQSIQIGVRN